MIRLSRSYLLQDGLYALHALLFVSQQRTALLRGDHNGHIRGRDGSLFALHRVAQVSYIIDLYMDTLGRVIGHHCENVNLPLQLVFDA